MNIHPEPYHEERTLRTLKRICVVLAALAFLVLCGVRAGVIIK